MTTTTKKDLTPTDKRSELVTVKATDSVNTIIVTGSNQKVDGTAIKDSVTLLGINNRINSGLGDDTIFGSTGSDYMNGGEGADTLNGGDGWDSAIYEDSDSGVTVNLATNTNTGGHAEGDIINDVEVVIGSDFDDNITGDAGNNSLSGGKGNDTINGGDGSDSINGGEGADNLDGGAGIYDRLSYFDSNAGVNVNLATNTASGGHAQGDTISNFERVMGSEFDDVLVGNNDDNILWGRGGNDTITTGGGNDTVFSGTGDDTIVITEEAGANDYIVDFDFSNINERFDLTDFTAIASFGDLSISSASGVSTISLPNGQILRIQNPSAASLTADDFIFSSTSGGVINVGSTNQRVSGTDGDDVINLTGGSNFVDGGVGSDTINGGTGSDYISGGAGADVINGGDGWDFTEYKNSSAGVNVNLETGTGTGGDAEGDTYSGIEGVTGSDFDDTITGSSTNNSILGGEGNDTINGGAGNDSINGGAGADTLDGGAGTADRVTYFNSGAAVNINLKTNSASGGDATGDTISNFENIVGSNFDDTLVGSDDNNFISGGAGNDTITGGLGADSLVGGAGNDTFTFDSVADSTIAGFDIIRDFQDGFDLIDLSSITEVVDFADLNITNSGGNTFIEDDGLYIQLDGVIALASDDFIF